MTCHGVVTFTWGIFVLGGLVLPLDAAAALKKRIVVMTFDDAVPEPHWGWTKIGQHLADKLASALEGSRRFTLLERSDAERALRGRGFNPGGFGTLSVAAKAGQLLGVSFLVAGRVTQFGVVHQKKKMAGRMIFVRPDIVRVRIECHLINCSTMETVKTVIGYGKREHHGATFDMRAAPTIGFTHEKFEDTTMGRAVWRAIDQAAKELVHAANVVPWYGRIIKVDEKERKVYLNAGSVAGKLMDREFGVYRRGEEVVDPRTGKSLGAELKKVGRVKVTIVRNHFSIAKMEEGEGMTTEDFVVEE